jgi:hypothetical protein
VRRDREDFRYSRSTSAREITIHVRDREDFRCRRSTVARKITIHIRDREDSDAAGPQLHGKLPYI